MNNRINNFISETSFYCVFKSGIVSFIGLVSFLIFSSFQSIAFEKQVTQPITLSVTKQAENKAIKLYQDHCQTCHGVDR